MLSAPVTILFSPQYLTYSNFYITCFNSVKFSKKEVVIQFPLFFVLMHTCTKMFTVLLVAPFL